MNGVEILNQTTIYETDVYWWIMWMSIGIGLIASLAFVVGDWIKNGFYAEGMLFVVYVTFACFFVGLIITLGSEHKTDNVDYIKYQVTVSEDVNFTEFTDKYKILGQEGKIYTVKERE